MFAKSPRFATLPIQQGSRYGRPVNPHFYFLGLYQLLVLDSAIHRSPYQERNARVDFPKRRLLS